MQKLCIKNTNVRASSQFNISAILKSLKSCLKKSTYNAFYVSSKINK